MRNTCIAGICSLMLLFALIACDDGSTKEEEPVKAAAPTASPAAGAVAAGTQITLATATTGAAIYYTTDGRDPTTASNLYSDSSKPTITAAATIKAMAVKSGMTNSDVLTASYTLSGSFIPVTDITGAPSYAQVNTPLTLNGTITPTNATNQTIAWSVKSAGTTGATISGSTLNTTATGTVVVTATIAQGASTTTDYSKDFTITVTQTKILASITITTEPTKKIYTVGDTLDPAGMVVTATYSDNTTATVTGYTTSGFNSSAAAANQSVTVSYTEGGVTKSATFTVTINPAPQAKTLASIAITTQPTKTVYTVGDTLSTAGMVVTATYSDNTTAAVTSYDTSGFDSSAAAASQTVTVSYTEEGVTKTADFTVTINATTGSGSISIIQPGANDPVLTASATEPADGYAADFTITAPTGYSSYKWLLDGIAVQTGTSNTFTIPVTTLGTGSHSVTLIAGNYSAIKNFKVQ